MPSLAMAEAGSATEMIAETITAVSGSTIAADRFKTLMENPLRFETATTTVLTGLNGRYTPLNKPFHLVNGTGGGLANGAAGLNGFATVSTSEVGEVKGVGANGDGATVIHVNGDSTGAKEEVISTEWPRIFTRPPGLKNFMSTCYMNSTLQALMHIPPLVATLLRETHNRQCISYPTRHQD
jgi:hypothetical protein